MALATLPFNQRNFGGPEFEEFICDFLLGLPRDAGLFGSPVRRAQRRGRSGQAQGGVDIMVWLEDGRLVGVECKNRVDWTVTQTETAIRDAAWPAYEYVLALTRSNDTRIHDAVEEAGQGKWRVWFGEDIERLFRQHLSNADGARILTTHFGAAVCKDFLGWSTVTYCVAARAFFAGFFRAERYFHHAWPILGRGRERKALDAFVRDPVKQVFVLPGAGGRGKSKLLHHFSRRFSQRHPEWSLRFLDIGGSVPHDLPEHLARLPKGNVVLVLDDTHRMQHDLSLLFKAARKSDGNLKLICGTRPQAKPVIDAALAEAGVDTVHVERADDLAPTDERSLFRWVEKHLPPNCDRLAWPVVGMAEGSWLLLTVAVRVIQKDQIMPTLDEAAMRDFVLQRFAEELVQGKLGPSLPHERVRAVLDLLAAFSPMPNDYNFLNKAGEFLRCRPSEIEAVNSALLDAGLLRSSHAGLRLTPDVFADHLLYQKCRTSPAFARELTDHFKNESLPFLLRNFSEVEGRLAREGKTGGDLLGPICREHRREYESARFHRRKAIVELWCGVAVAAPALFMELARLVMEERGEPAGVPPDAGEDLFEQIAGRPFDFQDVVEPLPAALAEVARHHAAHRLEAMEMLWRLMVDGIGNGRPLVLLGQLAGYNDWGSGKLTPEVPVQTACWLKDKLETPPVFLLRGNDAWAVAQKLMVPFLAQIRHVTTRIDRHTSAQDHALVASEQRSHAAAAVRSVAAAWCRHESPSVAHAGARLLDQAVQDQLLLYMGPHIEAARREHLPERLAALEQMALVWPAAHPVARWEMWRRLHCAVNHTGGREPISFDGEAKKSLALADDDPQIKLHRMFLSSHAEEFPIDWMNEGITPADAMESSAQLWKARRLELAGNLLVDNNSPEAVYELVRTRLPEWRILGLTIWDRQFCESVLALRPAWAQALLELMLSDTAGAGDVLGQELLNHVRFLSPELYHDAVGRVVAAVSPARPQLAISVINHFDWFRREGPLSCTELGWLTSCLRNGGEPAALQLLHMLQYAAPAALEAGGIGLAVAALEGSTSETAFEKSAEMLQQWKFRYESNPAGFPSVRGILGNWERWNFVVNEAVNDFFAFYVASHPADVWDFFTARMMGARDYKSSVVPLDAEFVLTFPPSFQDYEARLDELVRRGEHLPEADGPACHASKLWIGLAARSGGRRFFAWLEERVDSLGAHGLEAVSGAFPGGSDFVFAQPGLVKRLLERAEAFGRRTREAVEFNLCNGASRTGRWMETSAHRAHAEATQRRSAEAAYEHRMDATLRQFYEDLARHAVFRPVRDDDE